ncbi:nose resistant to fluoxetine protein 6-like [Daphnia carinata]|uniref:nose resistant to fluoxetine protein 6-like n=1 Tax=Daphnia carinata TaxID=120202 RepID=UPI002868AA29|nr:nose resistant to fluoxetine protein 6-like [Daphnia carinata]
MSTRLFLLVFLVISLFRTVPIINSLELPSVSQNILDEWWVHRSVPTASVNSDVSEECIRDTREYLTALHHRESWAVQMYESSGKVIENLIHIEGGENVHHESGLFDGCLSVQSDAVSFKGQYCTVFFGLEPVVEEESFDDIPDADVENIYFYQKPSVGFCLPSTCTASDLRSAVAQQVGHRVSKGKNFSIMAISSEDYCYTEEKIHNRRTTFDNVTLIVLSAFGLLAITVFTATGYDVLCNKKEQKTVDSSWAIQLLQCFSAKRNCKTLFETTENSKDDLSCLHGIRVLAICWIVLIHVGGGLTLTRFIYNRQMMLEKTLHLQFQFVTNGLFAVDTFFLLSGLLVAFTQLRQLDQNDGFFNIKRFYGHRYMRLTPVYAFVLAFVTTLYPYLGSGPDWHLIEQKSKDVRKNWWTNMLYINNYVHLTKNWWTNPTVGAGETWYLACDMQMLWISPLLIYPLWRWKRAGILCAIGSLLVCLAISTTRFIVYDLPATTFWLRTSDGLKIDIYADKHYAETFARFPSYIIGILLGWLLYKTKNKTIHINKCLVVTGWVMATLTGMAVTYGMTPYLNGNTVPVINPIVQVSYGVLHHSAWALVIGWVVFACTHGYGGFLHQFLSWKFFLPLSRLSYAVYLLHLHYMFAYLSHMRKPVYMSEYIYVTTYFGILVTTFIMAFAVSIFVEMPLTNLDKLLFPNKIKAQLQTKKKK